MLKSTNHSYQVIFPFSYREGSCNYHFPNMWWCALRESGPWYLQFSVSCFVFNDAKMSLQLMRSKGDRDNYCFSSRSEAPIAICKLLITCLTRRIHCYRNSHGEELCAIITRKVLRRVSETLNAFLMVKYRKST